MAAAAYAMQDAEIIMHYCPPVTCTSSTSSLLPPPLMLCMVEPSSFSSSSSSSLTLSPANRLESFNSVHTQTHTCTQHWPLPPAHLAGYSATPFFLAGVETSTHIPEEVRGLHQPSTVRWERGFPSVPLNRLCSTSNACLLISRSPL